MSLGYEPEGIKIYIFGSPVDMRKQINGLLMLVEGVHQMDPYGKSLFIFTNKKRDKIKALKWDENGFVVYYKRMERGCFRFPDLSDAVNGRKEISARDMRRLIFGLDMECELKKKRYISM